MEGWAVIHEIKRQIEAGLSVSEIAREMGLDRRTVRKYRDASEAETRRKRREPRGRPRKIEKYMDWLRDRVKEYEKDGVVNAESLYLELKERGYGGSSRSVRREVMGLVSVPRGRIYEPYETPIGQQAMVDLGETRRLRMGDRRETMYLAAMVLSHSRKKYGEWHNRPISTEMFLGFHERAFRAFGGIPPEVVYDQLKLAVIKERFGEVQFNEDFYAFARYHRFTPFICRKNDPETKGKIESVIRYAKRGFLPGRVFENHGDVQAQWVDWVENVADAKVHETTGKVPNEVWKEERLHLQAMSEGCYTAQPSLEKREVLLNSLVKVLGNRYSVPPTYRRKEVMVRVTDERVEIYASEGDLVYSHWRCMGHGQTIIEKSHYAHEYSIPTEELERSLLAIYRCPGMLEALRAKFPRYYRDQLKGHIRLARDHAEEDLQQAAKRALDFQCVGLLNLEQILQGVEANKQNIPLGAFTQGKILDAGSGDLRELSYYDQVARQKQEEQDELASL